ncbi:hypothetical protein FIBSPDRAFT_865697 [Athelia psychrophila]|uniref:Uncharacterized protein n=1 Tax=Athelia psychrophila TaxID=1759441 RepID=A0A166FET0_9AGAM|nr:hypothetical protein FIBSPDRAFT_865697 [Fibularhizoctonia sp. CBS 109695]
MFALPSISSHVPADHGPLPPLADTVPFAPSGTYVNDLSVDTTTGQRVHATFGSNSGPNSAVSIKFTKKGSYNMKAHCVDTETCLRSNHVVTVVS